MYMPFKGCKRDLERLSNVGMRVRVAAMFIAPKHTATETFTALPRSLIGGALKQEGNQNVLEQFQLQTDDPQSLWSLGQTDGWPIGALALQ